MNQASIDDDVVRHGRRRKRHAFRRGRNVQHVIVKVRKPGSELDTDKTIVMHSKVGVVCGVVIVAIAGSVATPGFPKFGDLILAMLMASLKPTRVPGEGSADEALERTVTHPLVPVGTRRMKFPS